MVVSEDVAPAEKKLGGASLIHAKHSLGALRDRRSERVIVLRCGRYCLQQRFPTFGNLTRAIVGKVERCVRRSRFIPFFNTVVRPPPALSSPEYAADLNETELYGSATSLVRTPAMTAIAYFWNANAINQINQTLQNVASQHDMDLLDTTRLLAAGNMVSTDAGMACFDSKYTYRFWRPITAIRNADLDGNPATTADPSWTPLVTTPNHPEYPSQHGCITSALAQVLANAVGTTDIDATMPGATGGGTTPTTSQTFATVDDLLTQLVNARVWIGFHYRHSVIAGENLGTNVANWELQRYFQPKGNQDG